MEQPPSPKRQRVDCEAPTATYDQRDRDDDNEQGRHEDARESLKVRWPRVPMQNDYEGGAFFYKRECYDEYYALLELLVLAPEKIVTMTGTPGIGKSVFYGYFFDRFRREHPDICVIAASFVDEKPQDVVVYKGDGREPVYHQAEDADVATSIMREATQEVRAAGRIVGGEPGRFKPTPGANADNFLHEKWAEGCQAGRLVVFLCDGPPDQFRGDCCVIFSNPDDKLLRTTRKYLETNYMPLWTREELYEAAAVLDLPICPLDQDSDANADDYSRVRQREAEIDRRYDIFGGTARDCLHPDPAVVAVAQHDLDEAIHALDSVGKLSGVFFGKNPESVRHRLVYFTPTEEDPGIKTAELASPYVVQGLTDQAWVFSRADRDRVCDLIRGFSGAASLHGSIFERQTHAKLVEGCALRLRRLSAVATGGESPTPGPDVETLVIIPASELIVSCRTETTAMLVHRLHHHAESKTWRSFRFPTMAEAADTVDTADTVVAADTATPNTLRGQDVIAWNAQPGHPLLLLLFLITVSKSHAVNAAGVVHLLTQLGLLESVVREPNRAALVFVVPRNIVDRFTRQTIVAPIDVHGSSSVATIQGISRATATALARYDISTVDTLREKIAAFDAGTLSVKPEDTRAWASARRCLASHELLVDGAEHGAAIATIPQYVCTWEDRTTHF